MKTFVVAAGLAAALAAGSAQAGGHVNWSIGINLPPVGAVISSGPGYGAYAPVYSGYDSPAVVVPAPVYAPPPVVVYRPAPPVWYPRVYAPLPIAYGPPPPRWHDGRGWRDGRWQDRGGWHDRDDRRWAPVPRAEPRDERRWHH